MAEKKDKDERLAAALRDNLKRRKAQARSLRRDGEPRDHRNSES